MKPIKIKGVEYDRLAVAGTYNKALDFAREYLYETQMPYTETNGRVHRSNGKDTGIFILNKSGRWYLLRPVNPESAPSAKTVERKVSKRELKTQKPTTMTRKRTTAKAHGSSTTMRDASRILKAQKDDYQKIFRAEVKKSKDPKDGAKKAGKIYRDRYGATATARWKKALKRAK